MTRGSSTRNLALAVGVLACVLLAAMLASATVLAAKKGKPRLFVAKLAPTPKTLSVSDELPVSGAIGNRGRRAYPTGGAPGPGDAVISFALRGGEAGRTELGTIPVGRVDPGERRPFDGSLGLPDSLDAGRSTGPYELQACVLNQGERGKRRCKVAGGELRIVTESAPTPAPPDPTPPVTPDPPVDPGPTFSPGARSLGDRLFPQIGNGGYDVTSYDIELDYDPGTNAFLAGTRTTIVATATQNLSELSLDFQRDLTVSAVSVDGRSAAAFSQVDATPEFAPGTSASQPGKLVVTPAAGIPNGSTFTVRVAYSGVPVKITDADGSFEGWIRACQVPQAQTGCDGSFTVNEPIGAQSWYPSNNYPPDKATIDTDITVPVGHETIGTGELLAPPTANGDGTATWSWREDDPTSTYLASATVGLFDYSDTAMVSETLTGRSFPIYAAIDSAKLPTAKTTFNTNVGLIPGATNFFSDRFGPYPFDSTGAVVDIAPDVNYALENQTKPHYAGTAATAQSVSTQAHEIAHQWMGDSVGPATWDEIWFNEGWATFSQTLYRNNQPGGATDAEMEAYFDSGYNNASNDWSVPPAMPNGPENLFTTFPVYTRPSLMLEGYREIVGNTTFFNFAKGLTSEYAYDTISIDEFIAEAKAASGLTGAKLTLLDQYFQQWLRGTTKPTLTPASFVP